VCVFYLLTYLLTHPSIHRSQIFFPSLTPRITPERWSLWRKYEREKHPHSHWIFEARNDLLTRTIESICHDCEEDRRRVVVVLGAAHCESILDRLTGVCDYDDFFDSNCGVGEINFSSRRDYYDYDDDDSG
jgi:hypothetical protein